MEVSNRYGIRVPKAGGGHEGRGPRPNSPNALQPGFDSLGGHGTHIADPIHLPGHPDENLGPLALHAQPVKLVIAHFRHSVWCGQNPAVARPGGGVAELAGQQPPRLIGVCYLDLLAEHAADKAVPRPVSSGQQERFAPPELSDLARWFEAPYVVVFAQEFWCLIG